MSGSLGQLPAQVFQNISEFGLAGATALATVQQRGADSSAALSYYSAVVSALVAIAGETVSIPTFGQFASVNYTYGIGTMPSPASKATVSKWVYGNAVLPPIAAVGAVVLYGIATLPPLRVLH